MIVFLKVLSALIVMFACFDFGRFYENKRATKEAHRLQRYWRKIGIEP